MNKITRKPHCTNDTINFIGKENIINIFKRRNKRLINIFRRYRKKYITFKEMIKSGKIGGFKKRN